MYAEKYALGDFIFLVAKFKQTQEQFQSAILAFLISILFHLVCHILCPKTIRCECLLSLLHPQFVFGFALSILCVMFAKVYLLVWVLLDETRDPDLQRFKVHWTGV